jgi:hypothetical protein
VGQAIRSPNFPTSSSYWGEEAVTRWVKTKVVAVVVVVTVAVAEQLFRRVADTHACSVF